MRIVIATPLFPPEIGDPAPYVSTLAKRLSSEHAVTIVTYANHVETLENVHIEAVPKKLSLLIRLFLYTRTLVRVARRADVIFAQRAVASGLPAYIASLLTGVPFVINFFEDEAWERLQHTDFEPQHQGMFRRMQKIPGAVWGIWNPTFRTTSCTYHYRPLRILGGGHRTNVRFEKKYRTNKLHSTQRAFETTLPVSTYSP
jgi:hypothetical protein